MSVRLVECASYGTTLVDAATAMIVEQAAAATRLAHAASLVTDALLADLPDAARAAAAALGTLAATAPDVAELIDALVPLASALRYGDVRGSDSVALTDGRRRDRRPRDRRARARLPAPRRRRGGGDDRAAQRAPGGAGDARPPGSARRSPRRPRQARRRARDPWAGARPGDTAAPRRRRRGIADAVVATGRSGADAGDTGRRGCAVRRGVPRRQRHRAGPRRRPARHRRHVDLDDDERRVRRHRGAAAPHVRGVRARRTSPARRARHDDHTRPRPPRSAPTSTTSGQRPGSPPCG